MTWVAKKKRKLAKRVRIMDTPHTAKERAFCDFWLQHFDAKRAYQEAGYAPGNNMRYGKMLERFAEYLRPLREAKVRAVAEKIVVDQEQILTAMARKAVFDPGDFILRAPKPLMREVTDKDGKKTQKVVTGPDGQPVYQEYFKPFTELTPAQRQTVVVLGEGEGRLRYRLPDPREQHTYLSSMGRQLGMFLEKIILERHQHNHAHAHLHLENVPTATIRNAQQALLPLVGADFAASLGFSPAEIEALIPVKTV